MRQSTQLKWIWSALLAVAVIGSTSQFCAAQGSDPVVLMQTSKGPLYIRVFLSAVPYTSRNFLDLVQRGFYNGLIFHRVETWCIQGGDPKGNGTGNFVDPATGRPRFMRLEINRNLRHNAAGVVAMARSNNPDSASCQFYITKAPMGQLDGQYSIFGGVVKGINTVFQIVPGDRIISAEIIESGSAPPQQNVRQGNAPGGRTPPPPPESGF
jgi:peptidyl-prolyl cis-trans isomerase B (cyclophilin B)